MEDDEDGTARRTTAGHWKWNRGTVCHMAVDRQQCPKRRGIAAKPADRTPSHDQNKTNLYADSLEKKLDPGGGAAMERSRCVRCFASPSHHLSRGRQDRMVGEGASLWDMGGDENQREA